MNRPVLCVAALLSVFVLSSCFESLPFNRTSSSSDSDNPDESDTISDTNSDQGSGTEGDTESSSDPVDAGAADAGDTGDNVVDLLGPPMVYAPTATSFRVNAVVATGDRERLLLFYRPLGTELWTGATDRFLIGEDIVEWNIGNLVSDTVYQYVVTNTSDPLMGLDLFEGQAVTERTSLEDTFEFGLVTDAHIAALNFTETTTDYAVTTLKEVGRDLLEGELPDFIMHLGDQLDFHQFGFNDPPPDGLYTRLGYVNYRSFLGDVMGRAAHFNVVGNWDGENGNFTEEEIARSRDQRLLYMPGPNSTTYNEGGSDYQDYYAFTWGDALFVVLNVMTYTPTAHELSTYPGLPDDWTLGSDQLAWLEQTLAYATSKWKFLFIHHTVGGNAGDTTNSAYGRGGGRAAYVGEQAAIHDLMLTYGVQIFFYGHDHVFMDMVVDGIHYTLPGSAGAPWMFDYTITGYPIGEYYAYSGYARVEVGTDMTHVSFLGLGNIELYGFTAFP
jgi:predicted phosphodiesterase